MGLSRHRGVYRDEMVCFARNRVPLGFRTGLASDQEFEWLTDTQGPLGKNDHADLKVQEKAVASTQPREIRVAAVDLEQIKRFLKGVAFWRVQRKHLNIKYKKDDSKFWEVLDKAIFWADAHPGTFEISTPSKSDVETEIENTHRRLLNEFVQVASRGPQSLKIWLEQLKRERDFCENGYRKLIAMVGKANAKISAAMKAPLKAFRRAKLLADVMAAGIGTYGGWGGTAYSIAYTYVTVSLEEWSSADAVAVHMKATQAAAKDGAISVAKEGAVKGVTGIAANAEKNFQNKMQSAQNKMKSVDGQIRANEKKIRKSSNRPARQTKLRDWNRRLVEHKSAARSTATKAAGRKAIAHGAGKVGGAMVNHAVFVWLVKDLWEDYQQDMKSYE